MLSKLAADWAFLKMWLFFRFDLAAVSDASYWKVPIATIQHSVWIELSTNGVQNAVNNSDTGLGNLRLVVWPQYFRKKVKPIFYRGSSASNI